MFDWLRFLSARGIDHVEGPFGSNVRPGHVGFNCPYCDQDDKYHYAVQVSTGRVRGCWRSPDHWRPPAQLIADLCGIPYSQAKSIYEEGAEEYRSDTESLAAQLAALDSDREEAKELPSISWPAESELFYATISHPSGAPYWDYLAGRGFPDPGPVAKVYGIRWAPHGDWSNRLLFPLYRYDGALVGWQGRDITGTSKAKYKIAPAGMDAAGVVFGWQPNLNGQVAVFCEGPLDALKLDWYAGDRPVNAFALLGLAAGSSKLSIMSKIAEHFGQVYIVLDRGEDIKAMSIRDELSVIGARVARVPEGVKDPGDMTPKQVEEFWDAII